MPVAKAAHVNALSDRSCAAALTGVVVGIDSEDASDNLPNAETVSVGPTLEGC